MIPVLLFGTPFSRSETRGKSLDCIYIHESTYPNGVAAYEPSVIALSFDGDSFLSTQARYGPPGPREGRPHRPNLVDGRPVLGRIAVHNASNRGVHVRAVAVGADE